METEDKRGKSFGFKIILSIVIIVIAAFVILTFVKGGSASFLGNIGQSIESALLGEEGKVTTITESTLEEVFEISELSSVEFSYNAIARSYADDGETIQYYVAYEGNVKAGIDFSDIEIHIDEEAKTIDLILPESEIQSTTVDFGSMEYIFKDESLETETISQEAYQLCRDDLSERAAEENDLLNMAKENAAAVVEALVSPWVEQIDSEYTVNIN